VSDIASRDAAYVDAHAAPFAVTPAPEAEGLRRDVEQLRAQLAEQERELGIARELRLAADRRARELTTANEVLEQSVERLSRLTDVQPFVGEVLKAILEHAGAVSGIVYRYDAVSGAVTPEVAICDGTVVGTAIDADRMAHERLCQDSDFAAMWRRTADSSDDISIWRVGDPGSDLPPCAEAWHRDQGHASVARLVLRRGSVIVGFLGLAFPTAADLTRETVALVRALARHMTMALELTRLAAESTQATLANERAAELARVNDALRRTVDGLATKAELSGFLHQVLAEAMRQIGSSDGVIMLFDPAAETLRRGAAIVAGDPSLACVDLCAGPLPASVSPPWRLLRELGAPIVADADCEATESWPDAAAWHRARGNRAVVYVPLILAGQTMGYFGLAVRQAAPEVSQAQLELVKAFAQQATLALHITELGEQAKETAIAREQERAAEERAAETARASAALQQSVEQLAKLTDVRPFVGEVLKSIVQHAGAMSGTVFRYDPAARTAVCEAAVLDGVLLDLAGDARAVGAQSGEPTGGSAERWLHLLDGQEPSPVFAEISDPAESMLASCVVEWHTARGHRNIAAVALRRGTAVVGYIGLAYPTPVAMTPQTIGLTRALAHHVTMGMELTRLAEAARSAAVADERTRLAHDIHDTLAQGLALIVMQLADAQDKLGPAWNTARKPLDTARLLASDSLAFARRTVNLLRPGAPLREGLTRGVQDVAELVRSYFTGTIDIRVAGTPYPLGPGVEAELLGIAREAMTNAAKHSRAERLDVELAFTDGRAVRLVVADNGRGFDPDRTRADAYGLVAMQERAARIGAALTLVTEPGAGTEIVTAWPA